LDLTCFCGHRRLQRAFNKAGIRHGDIAPRNVLRTPNGTLRLIDFGYSMLVTERHPKPVPIAAGDSMGTAGGDAWTASDLIPASIRQVTRAKRNKPLVVEKPQALAALQARDWVAMQPSNLLFNV
jgi:serine/threonine protein kinase